MRDNAYQPVRMTEAARAMEGTVEACHHTQSDLKIGPYITSKSDWEGVTKSPT